MWAERYNRLRHYRNQYAREYAILHSQTPFLPPCNLMYPKIAHNSYTEIYPLEINRCYAVGIYVSPQTCICFLIFLKKKNPTFMRPVLVLNSFPCLSIRHKFSKYRYPVLHYDSNLLSICFWIEYFVDWFFKYILIEQNLYWDWAQIQNFRTFHLGHSFQHIWQK